MKNVFVILTAILTSCVSICNTMPATQNQLPITNRIATVNSNTTLDSHHREFKVERTASGHFMITH